MDVNVPVLAVNVALLDPVATETDVGSVTIGLLELRLTLAPPVPAVPLRFTVQVLELPGPTEVGVHPRPVIVNGAITTGTDPPVAVTTTPSPARDAARALVTPIVVVPRAADIVTETVATIPL